MKRFGLIGHPISHSLSPALFEAAYGGKHSYDLIEGTEFEQSYRKFLESYHAVNVTAPFKEKACARADLPSPECKVLGACNILKQSQDGIEAHNTDYAGVMKCLLPCQTSRKLRPLTIIVGCGGAGKAAAYAACELGNEVIILNRTLEKALRFAETLSKHYPLFKIMARPLTEFGKWFRKAGTIIYTLPCGIEELHTLSRTDIKGSLFGCTDKVILEAAYNNPAFSSELQGSLSAINPKITFIPGQQWLLHQATYAFYILTGEEPNITEMVKVL
jgi:shikimate 5-dehydrogenase